jgi:1-acyl-sn-glycerol-3-phosphate acyltransferase
MQRPDLLAVAPQRLTRTERMAIRCVRRTFEPGSVDRAVRWFQRHVGSTWIHHVMKRVLHVHGAERLPELSPEQSFICVANHRSFFDLYVVTAYLVRRGLRHRIVFPVRSHFWYDRPLGLAINGVASFFAMYPPIFRERKKLILNGASLDEMVWLLRQGGTFLGFHPEGTRKKDDDPYTLLPAHRGIGRIVQQARVTVLPVFVNGLTNELFAQIVGSLRRTSPPILIVFGDPIDFSDLYDRPATPQLHQMIADQCLDAVKQLGKEELRLRAELVGPSRAPDATATD